MGTSTSSKGPGSKSPLGGHLRKRNLKYVKAESRQVANGTR